MKPAILLIGLSLAAQTERADLSSLTLKRIVQLEGATHHVQGIAVEGSTLWLTSVQRDERKGWLMEFDLFSGKRRRAVDLTLGAQFHPGGIDLYDNELWIPVAEYRNGGRSTIERRSKSTLAMINSFEAPDHIGAVAVTPESVFGANWDARKLYQWSRAGQVQNVLDNPTPARYQDMKFANGVLVMSGNDGAGGVIRFAPPGSFKPTLEIAAGRTDRGVPFTNEGMAVANGDLYLLPEDAPSRLFVYSLQKRNVANDPARLEWFRDLGFGMFIHWNVDVTLGSVISHSLVGASPDYVKRYFDVLPQYFDPHRFDPREWARLAKLAGMKYAVLTTKHHAGFTLWPSKTTPFNVSNTPFKKDIVKAFVEAFRAEGIAIGFYISPDDFWWFHENHLPIARPPASKTTTKEIPGLMMHVQEQTRELLTQYGPVDVFFIDGPADGIREEAWRAQPSVVVTRGAIETPEQQVPGVPLDQAWEACITIGNAWQHKPGDTPKSAQELVETLVEIRAKGGNLLLNVGPRPDGTLSAGEEGRLRDIALWSFVNHESIEGVRPWILTNEQNVWFTRKKGSNDVYAFVTRAPWRLGEERNLILKSVKATPATEIEILGQSGEILEYRPEVKPKTVFQQTPEGLKITARTAQRMYDDRRWSLPVVLKLTNVEAALAPPRVLTLAPASNQMRAELQSLGDQQEIEVFFEYRSRKGITDLYERDDPWKPLPPQKLAKPGGFTAAWPSGVKPEDFEYRAAVRHPLLIIYGAERPGR